ncbi:MAG: peptide chain release factor N(5)-glutamine methyltransferase [Bacillati bacterium ANGP1]|uniref:Release factor glutamine methyltransferase n=1 Tax=Candidatus Segetimicrobium genomatis TaxID=2569760 RepID=A0A537L822_9BACT|nr:MAG: peptide chain release factor N(5)-glutamine methyltransferase [Terrabacteria group bacterium ANGP1]
MTPSIREAYLMGREHLAASGSAEAPIEAEVLLRHVLQLDRAALYAGWDRPISEAAWDQFQRVLAERGRGRPVPYIVGQREFMGLTFAVDERVMIPRPETEVLVEFIVEWMGRRERGNPHVGSGRSAGTRERDAGSRIPDPGSRLSVVDVGTGSGCIAVSLAQLLPPAIVFATDISVEALEVARANAARHRVGHRITFLQGDLLAPLPPHLAGRVDAVAGNPPYVPVSQRAALPREIRDFEPPVAVFIGGDGIAVHRRLIAEAPRWLGPSGLLAMEVGAGQADAVAGVMASDGKYARVRTLADYGGIQRVVAGERAASS